MIFSSYVTLAETSVSSAQKLAQKWIIQVQTNSQDYKIMDAISRREMLKVMMNLSALPVGEDCSEFFSDLKKSDWGCKYAQKALEVGYISNNATFRPASNVSKIEAVKMILKAKNIPITGTETDWRKNYVQTFVNLKLGTSFTDYDTPAQRWFIFDMAAKVVDMENVGMFQKEVLNLKFSTPMNTTSVLANLKIHPEVTYTSTWKNDTELLLTLDDLIYKETQVLVNILDEAQTKSGNKIANPITKTFKIEGKTHVDFVSPEGDIPTLNQNITVRFSRPVVSLTNFDAMKPCPLVLSPALPGKCVWITSSTFQYRLDGNFPAGARIQALVPAGVPSVSGEVSAEGKSFTITTPAFELQKIPSEIQHDEKLTFIFNDEVDKEVFIKNFSLKNYNNSDLNFAYFEDKWKVFSNIITVYPKQKDWGYDSILSYNISKNLTSKRGNIPFGVDTTGGVNTHKFLLSTQSVILQNAWLKNPSLTSNFKYSQNPKIVIKKDPKLVLTFHEEVPLDASLFVANLPFTLAYTKDVMYDKENEIVENKKQILLSFRGELNWDLDLKVLTSKLSRSADISMNFQTKKENQITNFSAIDYKKLCLTTTQPIQYFDGNNKHIELSASGSVGYWYEVNKYYTPDSKCAYVEGKHTYVLNTLLNPSTSYNLTFKKGLLDSDNYGLERDYSYTFTTGVASNEDKSVSLFDQRENILVPKNISPLSVSLRSTHLSQVNVKVCEGDLDVIDGIKNSTCVSKIVTLKNLGWDENISVFNLEKIYGKPFVKEKITVAISKLANDQTVYEKNSTYSVLKTSFLKSDYAVVLESAKNPKIWVQNFASWSQNSAQISSVKGYKMETDYSLLWEYKGVKTVFVRNIEAKEEKPGMYNLWDISGIEKFLVILSSGENVLLEDGYSYESTQHKKITHFLSTSKPLYKAWEKVQISGISRELLPTGYRVFTGTGQLIVRNPQYEEIENTTISLSKNGTFEFAFDLDAKASLWEYSIFLWENSLNFSVQEYEKPEFSVQVKSQKPQYIAEKNAFVNVEAVSYIGMPVQNGKLDYNYTTQDSYFDGGKTTGYHWWEQKYFWWDYYYQPYNAQRWGGNGSEILDGEGKKTLSLNLQENAGRDTIYNVSVNVQDPNTKKTISNATSFIAYAYDTYFGLRFDKGYYDYKDTAKISLVSVDALGNKKPNQALTLRISKKEYVYNEETLQTDTTNRQVISKDLISNQDWEAELSFVFDEYGEYFVEVIGKNGYTTTQSIFVSGGNILRPKEIAHLVEITSEKLSYNIWENAEFTILSPVKNAKALVMLQKQDMIFETQLIDITSHAQKVSFSVKKEHIPNFQVKAYIVQNLDGAKNDLETLQNLRVKMNVLEQKLQKNSSVSPYLIWDTLIFVGGEDFNTDDLATLQKYRQQEYELLMNLLPNYYQGSLDVEVAKDPVLLDTKITLDKVLYLPGDTQKIDILVQDAFGKNITGEMNIALIDASLLALIDNKKDIIEHFYSPQSSFISTFSNLTKLMQRLEWNNETPVMSDGDASFDMSKWGGLGWAVAESSMDMAFDEWMMTSNLQSTAPSWKNQNSTVIRSDFQDLAWYQGKVNVVNGKATLQVPKLPDNLTTWMIRGYVVTTETQVWDFEKTFVVEKTLSLFPQVPRFFLGGDSWELSVLVVNNSPTAQTIDISIDAIFMDIPTKKQTITLEGKSSKSVWFPFTAERVLDTKKTKITFTATSKNASDSVQIERPVMQENSGEYIFTNGSTLDLSYEEKIDFPSYILSEGNIDISLWASILNNLFHNLEKQILFPSVDLQSRILFLEQTKILENIYKKLWKEEDYKNISLSSPEGKTLTLWEIQQEILKEMPNYLQADHGLSYYPNCHWYFDGNSCSNFEVTGKYILSAISSPRVSKEDLIVYYKEELQKRIHQYGPNFVGVESFLPLAKVWEKDFVQTFLKTSQNPSLEEKMILIDIYRYLWIEKWLMQQYVKDVKNSIFIEARGSFVAWENSVAMTAQWVNIFLSQWEHEKLLLENMLRYIVSQKTKNFWWELSSSVSVLQAIETYLDISADEQGVDFTAQAFLNGKSVFEKKFSKENTFSLESTSLAFSGNIEIWKENSLWFEKNGSGKLYYDVGLRYFLPTSKLEPRDEGIVVSRNYYDYSDYKASYKKECYSWPWMRWWGWEYCHDIKVKDPKEIFQTQLWNFVVWEIEITIPVQRKNIVVNDFIPAGMQIVNTQFATTSQDIKELSSKSEESQRYYNPWFQMIEQKDDRVFLYADMLPAWTYRYTYVLSATNVWKYAHKPAIAELLDTPEIWGRSVGRIFEIIK